MADLTRRGFLKRALGLSVGVVAGVDLAELLAPTRTIFLPPRGGWLLRWPDMAPAPDMMFTRVGVVSQWEELAAVTRADFIPRMVTQIYDTSPLLIRLIERRMNEAHDSRLDLLARQIYGPTLPR